VKYFKKTAKKFKTGETEKGMRNSSAQAGWTSELK
jgi:hypothetical protein